MATYKVKATMIVDVEVEIDSDSEENAISKFIQMGARNAIDDGVIQVINTESETAELIEADYKIRVKGIDYCIEPEDIWDQVAEKFPDVEEDTEEFEDLVNTEIEKIQKSLPQELDLEICCCAPEDLDDVISDTISEETGWLINSFDSYLILEQK